MPVTLADKRISPLGEGESVSNYVARSLQIIDESGLPYELHAMGTIIEGEVGEVLDVMRRCLDALAADCDRITCTAKLDYRQGYTGRLDSKVKSVEEKLGRPLKRSRRRD